MAELTINQALQQGAAAHKAGQLQLAERLYRAILKSNPKHADANHLLGVLAVSLDKTDMALTLFKTALETNPKNDQIWVSYIEALIKVKRMDNAKAILSQAKENGAKGDALNKLHQKLKSIGITKKNISESKKMLNDQLNVVASLYNSGEFQQAIEKITVLKRKFPRSAALHNICGATNRKLGRLDASTKAYKESIAIDPSHSEVYNNLGNSLKDQGKLEEAIRSYQKALAIRPAFTQCHNNLGLAFQSLGRLKEALQAFNMTISLNPNYAEAYYNLGNILWRTGAFENSIAAYKHALSLKTDYFEAYNSLGNAFVDRGELEEGMKAYKKALAIKPDTAEVFNNMATIHSRQAEMAKAQKCYTKALEINPNYDEVYWNLSGAAKDIFEAKNWVEKCVKLNPNHEKARLTLPALQYYIGEQEPFKTIINSADKGHPYIRSFEWVFGLPNLPELHFNRWSLFDQMVNRSKLHRPFYEFGVWRGQAFKYLIKSLKKGYGFDTFEGLPEDWHNVHSGTYSSDSKVPQIDGGEFIVGKFEETLPTFFSENRPMASIINFDADLYSSTICALNFSKPVIDEHTILIFDEFIINTNWEQDEYKALNEFCSNNKYAYEVLAISFFTKQTAVRLVNM